MPSPAGCGAVSGADYGLDARLVKPGLLEMYTAIQSVVFLPNYDASISGIARRLRESGQHLCCTRRRPERELAIRLAIGSSRWAILRGLLAEAILIRWRAAWRNSLSYSLTASIEPVAAHCTNPFRVIVLPDVKVYVVALLLSLASGILFGLLPAQQIRRSDAAQAIRVAQAGRQVFAVSHY